MACHFQIYRKRASFERQQAIWLSIVKDLAEKFSCPISEVEKLLSTTAQQLEQEARIQDQSADAHQIEIIAHGH